VIEGFDLAAVSAALDRRDGLGDMARILTRTMSGGSSRIKTLDGSFTITDGIIRSDDITLIAEAGKGEAKGSINLPRWTIDMQTRFRLTDHPDLPAIPMNLRGPLDEPRRIFPVQDIIIRQGVEQLLRRLVPKPAAAPGAAPAAPPAPGPTAPVIPPVAAPTVPPVAAPTIPSVAAPTVPPVAAPVAPTAPAVPATLAAPAPVPLARPQAAPPAAVPPATTRPPPEPEPATETEPATAQPAAEPATAQPAAPPEAAPEPVRTGKQRAEELLRGLLDGLKRP
jgi:AsmA-like C-terminal region